jgi:hypothetical protein
MNRVVSDEFWDFCKGLHQDVELNGPTEFDWIRGALRLVKPGRHAALHAYLGDLLRRCSDAELQEHYDSTWKEISFRGKGDLRLFLTLTRDVIASDYLAGRNRAVGQT